MSAHPTPQINWRIRGRVAEALKLRRNEMKLSQMTVASMISKSQGFVTRYERMNSTNDTLKLSVVDYTNICHALGLPPVALIQTLFTDYMADTALVKAGRGNGKAHPKKEAKRVHQQAPNA